VRPGHAAGKSIDEGLLDVGGYSVIVDAFTELVAVVVLLGAVLLVGSLGRNRYGELLIGSLDGAIASISSRTIRTIASVGSAEESSAEAGERDESTQDEGPGDREHEHEHAERDDSCRESHTST
jgi:hypothetical protein